MIAVRVDRLSATMEVAQCLITVTGSPGTPGGSRELFGTVEILDRNRLQLFVDSIPDCTSDYSYPIDVSQRLLPIWIRVRQCGSGIVITEDGPWIPPDPGITPCSPGEPPAAACQNILSEISRRNEAISYICAEIRRLDGSIVQHNLQYALVQSLAVGLIIAAAIASAFGPIGAGVAAALLAGAAGFEIIAISQLILIAALIIGRNNAFNDEAIMRAALRDLADNARRVCCPHDLESVNLNPPPCS